MIVAKNLRNLWLEVMVRKHDYKCISDFFIFISDALHLYRYILGFGAFMFFVAFAVFLSAAIYVSPVFCGSNTEKKMVSKPQEIDAG